MFGTVRMLGKVRSAVSAAQVRACAWALGVLAVVGLGSSAHAQSITLPDTGVDMEGAIQALVTGLGSVVVACVLAFFAFLLVRKGLRWARGVG